MTKTKKVKGWALIKDGEVREVTPNNDRYKNENIAWWVYEHEIEDLGHSLIPCTITYSLPKKQRKI